MQSSDQKQFTNPGDGPNPFAGELAGRAYAFRRSDLERGGREMSRSPGRSAQFDRQISVHEAGHTVASRLLNLPLAGSTIELINGHHGSTWASDAALQPGAESVADLVGQLSTLMPCIGEDRDGIAVELQRSGDQVIALLAGVEAEKLFTTEPLPGTGHDLEEARAIAGLICRSPRSVDAYIGFCRCEATALLLDHRDVVIAVADELIKYRTLDGSEIDDVIRAARLCSDLEAGR
jgi:hypothetical protein